MKKLLPLFFVLGFYAVTFSQTKYRVLNVPVERNGIQLREPLAGGMNCPQFSEIDLNCDNLKDLFVFDRVGDKVMTFINTGSGDDTAYRYAPQFETVFPDSINSWVHIRDYNMDGIPDIFSHANTGTRVHKGSRNSGVLEYNLSSQLLVFDDSPFKVNIWTAIDDIPAVVDVNRDGDMDMLTFGIFGSTVEYYENQTMEHLGNPDYAYDSLRYLVSTYCWGNFLEASLTNTVELNISCKGGGASEAGDAEGARHSGSTLFDLDFRNDHDTDLLIGDISYPNLVLVDNCGDSSYANVCWYDSMWSDCDVTVDMPVFPGGFGADYNNDGFKDVLVSPNARNGSRDVNNVMLYRNTDNPLCYYVKETDSFIVEHELDFGTESKPYFFDYNGDGLLDILVGNYGYFRPFTTYKSTIAYLENVGTANSPAYLQRTDDLSNISSYNLIGVHPAFGDLDGDGKQDMVVGELNGYLHYFKNNGGGTALFNSMTAPQYFSIDAGQYSTPFLYDLNGDSLLDLMVGKKDGKLNYYRNMGTKFSPLFHNDSVVLNIGGVNVTQYGYSDGSSAPFITKEGNDLVLYCGSLRGIVFKYLIPQGSFPFGAFAKVDSNYLKADVGSKSTLCIADINNDGQREYLAGNSRGGILLYSDANIDGAANASPSCLSSVPEQELVGLKLYPNPAKGFFSITLEGGVFTKPTVEVYTVFGQKVVEETRAGGSRLDINTAALSTGFYLVRVTDNGKTFTAKIIVE